MYQYFVSDQLARLTIILGIVVSTIIYKQTGRTLGGVIVCGYLALFIGHPLHIIVTLVMAYITFQIVHNFLKKRFMLNGRKLFEFEILVGLVLQVSWLIVLRLLTDTNTDLLALYGIGFVLPGVIAHDMGRQGPLHTLTSVTMGVMIISTILIPLSAIEQVLPSSVRATSTPILRSQPYLYTYPVRLLPYGIIASILIDLFIYARLKFRSGGFVTAAYLALFALRPYDLLFVIVCGVVTYLFVKLATTRIVLAFGRIKLGMMILSGVVISWLFEILIINITNGRFVPWSGFVVIMPTIVSLIANDLDRQGPFRTMAGISISASGVWLAMQGFLFALSALDLSWFFVF
jgi:poly-gamma-glutamate biosynthesis protein PgsC/CapC